MPDRYEKLIFEEFGIVPMIAGELEFYLDPAPVRNSQIENDLLGKILFENSRSNIKFNRLDKEVVEGQYEFSLNPKTSLLAVTEIIQAKELIAKVAAENGYRVLFEAKPYPNLPGCGMHIHVSLLDNKGVNLLRKMGENIESVTMKYAVGGLCATMLKNFTAFAPYEKSYLRFTAQRNSLQHITPVAAHNNAPVNISWGGNNRSTAIRIPASTVDENQRHIEHRVAGADADPTEVVRKILEGIYLGLREKILPPEKIYGNAYDKQYSNALQPFPKTLAEAIDIRNRFMN